MNLQPNHDSGPQDRHPHSLIFGSLGAGKALRLKEFELELLKRDIQVGVFDAPLGQPQHQSDVHWDREEHS